MAGQSEAPRVPLSPNTPIEEVLQDIDGYIHGSVPAFFPKYFAAFDPVAQRIIETAVDGGSVISTPPLPKAFLDWLSTFSIQKFEGVRGHWHSHSFPASEPNFATASLFLTALPAFDPDANETWRHVQVIGQFSCSASVGYQDGLLELCNHARKIFTSQPTRYFLHGFYLRESLMELWVFDRSGIFSSSVFDYLKDFERFLSVLLGYQLMTDKELGKNDTIHYNEAGGYIVIEDSAQSSLGQRLLLEDEPIAFPEDLIGNGTTCYRARAESSSTWEHVVKFKWRLVARDRPEEVMLKLIKDKNVWGVISLDYCKQLNSTENLRQGLQCGRYRKFRMDNREETMCMRSAGQERQPKNLLAQIKETDRSFENRICTCIIISPVGRPLCTFKSRLELLQVLRDAIKAHRSLLQDANVLHQDISPGNIIIRDTSNEVDAKGILIDFDVAMDLAVGPRTPGEVTGTRPFMAIGILLARPHRYRHDLESFMYVFIWTIITNGSSSPPRGSRLRQWSRGDWDELAARKTLDMEEMGFERIVAEFPIEFTSLIPLAKTLRRILFPIENGEIWTGTDSSPEALNGLYDGLIEAFNRAIDVENKS